ncbi:MAG: hypothetical protein ACOY4O_01565 [Pseudomonadota bacterium]
MTDTDEAAAAAAERDFQREKVIFEQDCQEFRSLNGFLWQIPVIVSTLTGGLWFGAGKIDDRFLQASLFLLAGCANLCFVVVLWRLRRGVMEPLLGRITKYQGRPRNPGKYTMIIMFSVLLTLSCLLSLAAFIMTLTSKLGPACHVPT